ncbi:uncharacterized protein BYT42DRAFT_490693, partial [Radiomyces spectabilis]|uniref:uncharacterized protein n=1 Tax=Radiomyces spectabilis TaxID=64574 RepID=UPI002220CEF3
LSTMATPEKAVILYNHCPPQESYPAIDELARRGCSGRLTLEVCDRQSKLNGACHTHDVTSLAEKLGFAYAHAMPPSADIVSHIERLMAPDAPQDIRCLLIDFTSEDSKNSWRQMDDMIQSSLDTTPHLLKCVVSPCKAIDMDVLEPSWSDIIPRQSCVMKNGVQVAVDREQRLMCSYLHVGSTRQDTVTHYNAEEITAQGCNATILAWHFLAEIGHKLGFVPKYGA